MDVLGSTMSVHLKSINNIVENVSEATISIQTLMLYVCKDLNKLEICSSFAFYWVLLMFLTVFDMFKPLRVRLTLCNHQIISHIHFLRIKTQFNKRFRNNLLAYYFMLVSSLIYNIHRLLVPYDSEN